MKSNPWYIFGQGVVFGIFGLSAFYFLLLFAVTQDLLHPITQFTQYQPWMTILIIGFGIQIGLFRLMRRGIHFSLRERSDANMAAGTGTAVSGIAMVACCAHHLIELTPILGLSAAAIWLGNYQEQFLILGVLANGIGIVMMLWLFSGKAKPKLMLSYLSFRLRGLL